MDDELTTHAELPVTHEHRGLPPAPRGAAWTADGAAFRAMFDREVSYVIRTLRRLGVRDADVEDVAQEVFIAVHRRLDSYDPSRPIRPWLFGFAMRTAANYVRGARLHREVSSVTFPEGDGGVTPEQRLTQKEAQELVLRALQSVPLERRTALILHDLDEVDAPSIAETLGIPLNTVYSRVRIARDELRRAIRAERLRRGES